MNVDIITSFNKQYYDNIGRNCVESWLAYWPTDLELTVYIEDFELAKTNRIIQIDFNNVDSDYWNLKESVTDRAARFAKKAYSFIHAMENSTADRIIWIDADVITINTVSWSLLSELLPDQVLSTHLGVVYKHTKTGQEGNWFVPETGFFAVNTRHKHFDQFRSEYKRRYFQRDFGDLRRCYDNDVYGAAIKHCNTDSLDLCKDLIKTYKTPFKRTVLGNYLMHYKAKHSKQEFQRQ